MQEKSMIKTCYGPVDSKVLERAKGIRLLICDVDGVMSDGSIYLGNEGEELKAFNVKDRYGIRCLLMSDIEVAIISGRSGRILENFCSTLGHIHLYQGQSDKTFAFRILLEKLELIAEKVAYIGDDLIDIPVMKQVGLSIAVANAHPLLKLSSHYITSLTGGRGAVREVCDLVLLAQGKWDDIREKST
ncbi:3-deoxy-D-manno-octulosonate 8-phosphate phosphatase, YrbI family [secondary endosymbiont of Heteropsylla cubana]|uniref:3-deoxy-D-manno-octulosonate 8-phosphate phosphatase KdsC n=1 Tax=secondary endosymbiont of Heteropsylla cubana TaxID=134287 RepID=J3Z5B3_9ENTR|nr:3-deoxy-manno-octulosonate-8-phosphatase KdsC [secondary endosymbiont of Heteropsylla cubana]AFP85509.1 3-deoxy-D-manno-octulosonate 8-phosphate phosphatase, YrbI family [secondary endosymbiont of Heteropsylla cubana]